MSICIITSPITRAEASHLGKEWYTDLIKGVVDIKNGVIALGGEYHMDANVLLIEHGSEQENVWGFNIYPDQKDAEWIEYISLINIRPKVNNRSMEVEDQNIRATMKEIIERLII